MRIGVMGALAEEVAPFLEVLQQARIARRPGIEVMLGRLDGLDVAVTVGGIGKVDAATSATLLCAAPGCRALVCTGVAGGVDPDLAVGDLVVATRIVDADFGRATDAGRVVCRPGSMPLPGIEPSEPGFLLPPDLEAAVRGQVAGLALPGIIVQPGEAPRVPGIHLGTVATTDAFVASEGVRDTIGRDTGALVLEMEGSAVARVAERVGVPWLVVRAVSDRAGTDSLLDFQAFLPAAASSAATLVRVLLPAVAAVALTGQESYVAARRRYQARGAGDLKTSGGCSSREELHDRPGLR